MTSITIFKALNIIMSNILFIFNDYPLHNHIITYYKESFPSDKLAIIKLPLVLKGKSRTQTAEKILPKLSKRFIWSKFKEFCLLSLFDLANIALIKNKFKKLSKVARSYKIPLAEFQTT